MTDPGGRFGYYARDGKPVTFEEWAQMLTPEGRMVARTVVKTPTGRSVLVSTVWLGLDMNYYDDGPPLIFETMTFDSTPGGDPDWTDLEVRRYSTQLQALTGHDEVVHWLQQFGYEPYVDPAAPTRPAARRSRAGGPSGSGTPPSSR
jgi:hypothetical protein